VVHRRTFVIYINLVRSGAGWQALSGNRESQEYERPPMSMTGNYLALRSLLPMRLPLFLAQHLRFVQVVGINE
jgi:hypothetical protein